VTEPEIATIAWHEDGEVVELVYVDGASDRLVGTQSVVAELARSIGLVIVPAPPGMVRWVRDPEAEPRSPG
jgi:hypothetical protein